MRVAIAHASSFRAQRAWALHEAAPKIIAIRDSAARLAHGAPGASVISMRRFAFWTFAMVQTHAAGALSADLGDLQQPIIYGEDDRLEAYEVEDDSLRARASESAVAITTSLDLSYQADGAVSASNLTLGDALGLCAGEAFLEQPVWAWCSGVLLDDDLVATAGHCLGDTAGEAESRCAGMSLLFGYRYDSPGQLRELRLEDVYRCSRVVAWSNQGGADAPDFAVIQLDRPAATPYAPAPVSDQPVEVGQRIHSVGFGSGLPLKVDSGARVMDVGSFDQYFLADTDTFASASGSPMFNDAGELVGIHSGGQPDWEQAGTCTRAVRTNEGSEFQQRATSVRDAVCDAGWPSERLCQTAPSCGDGVCSPSEACEEDCSLPSCGDGLCEGAGEPLSCPGDCTVPDAAPEGWTCEPSYYGDRLGCDCDCGVWDVDCADPRELVLRCPRGNACDAAGDCVSPEADPEPLGAAGSEVVSFRSADGDGCTCSVVASPPARPALPLLLGLLSAYLLRRRRRA